VSHPPSTSGALCKECIFSFPSGSVTKTWSPWSSTDAAGELTAICQASPSCLLSNLCFTNVLLLSHAQTLPPWSARDVKPPGTAPPMACHVDSTVMVSIFC